MLAFWESSLLQSVLRKPRSIAQYFSFVFLQSWWTLFTKITAIHIWASFVWLILKPRLHPSFPLHWIGTCNYNIELPFQTRKENTQNSFACKPCKRHDFIMCITNLKEVCLTYGVALVQFLTQWIRCGLRPKVWIDLEPNTMKHIIYS